MAPGGYIIRGLPGIITLEVVQANYMTLYRVAFRKWMMGGQNESRKYFGGA